MRLDWELARRGYRRYAAYPWATAAGLFTNVFFGLLIASILLAVYDQRDEVGGYDVGDAMAYVWLAQGLLAVVGELRPELVRAGAPRPQRRRRDRPATGPSTCSARSSPRTSAAPRYQALWRAAPQFVLGALLFEITDSRDPRSAGSPSGSASASRSSSASPFGFSST